MECYLCCSFNVSAQFVICVVFTYLLDITMFEGTCEPHSSVHFLILVLLFSLMLQLQYGHIYSTFFCHCLVSCQECCQYLCWHILCSVFFVLAAHCEQVKRAVHFGADAQACIYPRMPCLCIFHASYMLLCQEGTKETKVEPQYS